MRRLLCLYSNRPLRELSRLVHRFRSSYTYFSCSRGLGCQFRKQPRQVAPRKGPLEWAGQGFIVALEGQQPVLHGGQGMEVVRCQDLALDNGKVDLNLIEPTRMDGPVHQHEIRILPLQSFHGARATVSRAVVDDPEDTSGVAVRRHHHHMLDEAVERVDTRRRLATAKEP